MGLQKQINTFKQREIMRLFIQNDDGSLAPTDMKELLKDLLGDEFDWESGAFGDGSANWIQIRQRNKEDTKEISVHLCFSEDRQKIVEVEVFDTPVKTIVDDANTIKLI